MGAQSALGRRSPTPEVVRATLAHLADRVAARMRESGRAGRTVTVRVRFAEMVAVTRSLTLAQPVSSTLTLTEIAERLAWRRSTNAPATDLTLLAISVSQLTDQRQLQLELDLDPPDPWRPGSQPGAARWAVDASMDAIRRRFGRDAVGYAPALLGRARPGTRRVPRARRARRVTEPISLASEIVSLGPRSST